MRPDPDAITPPIATFLWLIVAILALVILLANVAYGQ